MSISIVGARGLNARVARMSKSFESVQEELYRRAETDGDCFMRMFPQSDGDIALRFIEPECIVAPYQSRDEEWSLGIKTDPTDTQNRKWYNIRYCDESGQLIDEKVKAKWIIHYKLNASAASKRGMPSFSYATLESFNQALKLKTALGTGAAVQASIAGIREHNSATEA
ncbi:MAG: phage portal protein, partial [Actinobacteria bacterium]|nr:phage portal protein [Actinomycetota bacterium]